MDRISPRVQGIHAGRSKEARPHGSNRQRYVQTLRYRKGRLFRRPPASVGRHFTEREDYGAWRAHSFRSRDTGYSFESHWMAQRNPLSISARQELGSCKKANRQQRPDTAAASRADKPYAAGAAGQSYPMAL